MGLIDKIAVVLLVVLILAAGLWLSLWMWDGFIDRRVGC